MANFSNNLLHYSIYSLSWVKVLRLNSFFSYLSYFLLQEIFEEILCSSDQDLVSLDNTLSRFANLFLEKYIKDKISVLFEALSVVRKLIFWNLYCYIFSHAFYCW